MRYAVVVGLVACIHMTEFARADDGAGRAATDKAVPAPSAREIHSAIDAYLSSTAADAPLVGGGAASAGYAGGFWIRSGAYSLSVGLGLKTKFEAFDWDDRSAEAAPGGDLSGFSLSRTRLSLDGTLPCCLRYGVELEFGHGLPQSVVSGFPAARRGIVIPDSLETGPLCREAWIGFGGRDELTAPGTDRGLGWTPEAEGLWSDAITRMGQRAALDGGEVGLVPVTGPRQLSTPELYQQFDAASIAMAWVGGLIPGYTDMVRDIGVRLHGEWHLRHPNHRLRWIGSLTNGDPHWKRNVLDETTDDHLGLCGRIDWSFGSLRPLFQEGALRSRQNEPWFVDVGAWGYSLHHAKQPDRWLAGIDLLANRGSFSFTGGWAYANFEDKAPFEGWDGQSGYFQAGWHFEDTPWEVVARVSYYDENGRFGATEWSAGANYYIDGHSNRLHLGVTRIVPENDGNALSSPYAGYLATGDSEAWALRASWQLEM